MLAKSGLMTAPCGVPSSVDQATLFEHTCRQPLGDQSDDPSIANPMFDEADQPGLADLVEKGLDVAINDPVDTQPADPKHECIQRLVLVALRSEPVTEPQELRHRDRHQDCHHCRLDNLIFQSGDAERSLSAIRLRNISPSRWQRSIRSCVDASMKVPEILLEAFRVFSPRQLVLSVPDDGFSYAGLRL